MNVNNTLIEDNRITMPNEGRNSISLMTELENKDNKKENSHLTRQENNIKDKKETIIDAIEKASGKIQVQSKGLEFSIHEKTNKIMIKVIDTNTHETIKEVPSEKILDMIAKMVELSGVYIDERR